jgi:hypothetical protein
MAETKISDLGRWRISGISEDRLTRIERPLAALATKSDVEVAIATAVVTAGHHHEPAVVDLHDALAELADKTNLTGSTKNVETAPLGRQLDHAISETKALRDDIRLLAGVVNGIAAAVQALADRIDTLESQKY